VIKASKRERLLLLTALGVIGLYLIDTFVLTPLGDAQAELRSEQETLEAKLLANLKKLKLRRELAPRWRSWAGTTLLGDPSKAENQVLSAVRSWSHETGVEITSLQPGRPAQRGKLREIRFLASTTGSYEGLIRFLYRFRTATIPVRIHRLDLRSQRGRSSERLVLDFHFSTLYRAREPEAGARGSQGGAGS